MAQIAREGQVQEMRQVWNVVERLEDAGLKPSPMAASHLMGIAVTLAAMGEANVQDGHRILEWAKGNGINIDTVLYSLQMDLLSKCAVRGGASFEDGLKVLEVMKRDGAAANVITYTSLLDLCAQSIIVSRTNTTDISRVLTMMEAAGIAPNEMTLTTLLAAYAEAARQGYPCLTEAHDYFERMRNGCWGGDGRAMELRTSTYNALLDVYGKSVARAGAIWPECLALVETMKERNVSSTRFHAGDPQRSNSEPRGPDVTNILIQFRISWVTSLMLISDSPRWLPCCLFRYPKFKRSGPPKG